MRIATFVLLSALTASLALASACSERFPLPNTTDAGVSFAGDAGLLEPQPPEIIAADKRRDVSSSPVVFDVLRGGVWTANGDVGSVSYVDVDKSAVVQEIAVGGDVRSIALSPDARFVAAVDRAGARVTLIDAESRAVLRAIAVGTHPRAAVWDAANPRWLYVAIEDDDAIAVIDRTTGTLAHEIPVGRLPSGLAVSRLRSEIYVTHRIDGRVSVVATDGVYSPGDQGAVPAEIALADEAATSDPKVPHGRPFAFESLAILPDGNGAWLPHELLAPTHPIQFQSTLFPAISVVDLAKRAEVQTDPAEPNGVIAGRKNLFAGISLVDPTGNLHVVSQPCAAVVHPSGFVAYAIACASEDLLTFDVKQGIASDILRNLPGEHPVGIALDDTGARAFVVSDQSHSLTVIDTAGGSPLRHAAVLGAPIALAAKDPVDPDMRAGLKFFFSANSSNGKIATTGNNWMACGGCHLDGFVSTNQALFESAHVQDPTKDAQLGHVGLKDLFSTAPTPADASFDPHDVLVAFTDQGGLAPDRRGDSRAGAIDPSAPSDDARAMAKQVAHVIARDLPIGPSWLLTSAEPPKPDLDTTWCGGCHVKEYLAWRQSVHAHAAEDPMVIFGEQDEQKRRGPQYSRLCAGCHDPVSARLGDTTFTAKRSITCLGCHDTERMIRAGGNGDFEQATHDWTQSHKERATASLVKLRDPQFCGTCHQQFVPGTGLLAIETLHEWQSSDYATSSSSQRCVDCHLPKTDGIADHAMIGGNLYMATKFPDSDPQKAQAMQSAENDSLKRAMQIAARRAADGVHVTVMNKGAGHAFPTGVTDIREPWVEVQAVNAMNQTIARFGGPDDSGLIPASAARLGIDIASSDGTVLLLHELSETTRVPFDRRVPAKGQVEVVVPIPATLPDGTAKLQAVLLYRNVRTTYFRAATGDAKSASPEVEITRADVP